MDAPTAAVGAARWATVAAVLLALPGVLGSLAYFFTRERLTLVDLWSGTRVLLDVR